MASGYRAGRRLRPYGLALLLLGAAVPRPPVAAEAQEPAPAEAAGSPTESESEEDAASREGAEAGEPSESAGEELPAGEEPPAQAGEGAAGAETGGEESAVPRPPLPERLAPIEGPLARPARRLLRITADAECDLSVDGQPIGRLAAGETLEVELDGGLRKVSARSLENGKAVWEREVVVREGGRSAVSIHLEREIRKVRRAERRQAVLRRGDDGLMWARQDNLGDVRWEEAGEFCAESRLAGFEDWRLPTMAELRTLEAIWSRASYKIVGVQLSGCCPWSSEAAGGERAWNLNFAFRKPFDSHRSYSLGHRALCVRDYDPEVDDRRPEDEAEDEVEEQGEDEAGGGAAAGVVEPGSRGEDDEPELARRR